MAPRRTNSRERREQARLRKRNQRKDPIKRENENRRKAEANRLMRSVPAKREAEQRRNTEAHRVTRSMSARKEAEQLHNTEAHRLMRSVPARREAEQRRDTEAHRLMRSVPAKRETEKRRDTEAHRLMRSVPAKRETEKRRDTEAHRLMRSLPAKREVEQRRDTAAHQRSRRNPVKRKAEQLRDSRARQLARANVERRRNEQRLDALRKAKKASMDQSYTSQMATFFKKIREGPTHICSCCGRLWYKSSITNVNRDRLANNGLDEDLISKLLHVRQESHGLCSTCWKHGRNGKLPKLALVNGFGLPEQPDELKGMSPLEERLVAARIPFAQIRAKGLEKQSALFGNIVNVECDLNECAKTLPRQFNETSVVQVMFKRRREYKHPVWNERIRPFKVYTAAKYLIGTPGYQNQNVVLSTHWNRIQDADSMDFVVQNEDEQLETVEDDPSDMQEFHNPAPEHRVNLGAEETLVYDNSQLFTIAIAPGENKVPIPLNRDLRAEELSFPCTWCGQERVFDESIKISLTDAKRSDIMQYDRRAATPQQVLYAFRKSNNEQIKQQIQICLRRRKGSEAGRITAGNIKTPGFVDNLVQVDDGYMVFKNIRCSPAYWKAQTKRVVAMVRQKGKCSLFLTLSAAETKWPELLVILMKIVKGKTITEDEALKLTFEQKAELIRLDPVTCMRHFDYKYRNFLSEILKHKNGALSPHVLSDFFSRLEFQVRGSPHIHSLLWINDAPQYIEGDSESEANVITFVDKFITCKRDEEGDMENLIGYQIHQHSQTCKKGRNIKCRFQYPKPPMPSTKILHPLPKETTKSDQTKYKALYRHIVDHMNALGRSFKEDVLFEEFLESLECSEKDYLMAIRSSIKRDTVFLKRETSGMFVNAYNKKMLLAWRANMDLQFVLDSYACAKYCVGYVMKAESGVSKLLQAADRDIRRGNFTIQEKLYKYASVLINGTEMSAQEAVAYLMGLPMTRCSRTDVFINTSPKTERVSILKPNEKLQMLEDDDEDVFEKGLIDHYINRPFELEAVCLAEFASMYNFSSKKQGRRPQTDEDGIVFHTDDGDENRSYKMLDGSGYVKRRRVQKIIRFRNYSKAIDELNHCREQMMLFLPWRDEDTDIGTEENIIIRAQEQNAIINNNAQPFYANRDFQDSLLQDEINNINEENDNEERAAQFEGLDVQEMEDYTMQFITDARSSEFAKKDQIRLPEKVSDNAYYALMQSLNEKQRRFVISILHNYKTGQDPLRIFLSGGAGVGKSHVISAIIQSLRRHDELFPSQTPDDVSVLVAAPTGKAAFNVRGMTVHSTFHLPPTQSKTPLLDLQAGPLNTIRVKFRSVKMIIIDEVSMLSSRDFFNIDKRLRQIFNTSEDFGGRSILVVGHLRQLPPVMATFVFANPDLQKGSLAGNYLWKKFQFYEFDEIQRQKGELLFCKSLNNMAEGTMDDEDEQLIKDREIRQELQPPSDAVHLFYSNKDSQDYNIRYHESLGTESSWSYAFDRIEGQGSEFRKRQILHAAKDFDASKSDGIPFQVHLQVGAIYFVSTNVDVKDGLFNGSTGTLMRIDYSHKEDGTRIPTATWFLFQDESIGSEKRGTTRSYQIANGIPISWTLIERVTRNLSKLSANTLQVVRTQLPLVAANGMTIHKSQGSTLKHVVVHIGTRGLKRDLKYVACSRAASLNGLFIDGNFTRPSAPSEADPVTKEMIELRKRPMIFPLRFLQDYSTKAERLYFHNVQSFPKYKLDLEADHSIVKLKASTLMVFVEPHILERDDVSIDNFRCTARINSTGKGNSTKSDGVVVFRQGDMPSPVCKHQVLRDNESHLTCVEVKIKNATVIGIYRHPKFPIGRFYTSIEDYIRRKQGDIIIVGDINLDMQKEGHKLCKLFSKYGFESKVPVDQPTTNGNTTIDICFSNADVTAWLMETYYSYHKSICVVW